MVTLHFITARKLLKTGTTLLQRFRIASESILPGFQTVGISRKLEVRDRTAHMNRYVLQRISVPMLHKPLHPYHLLVCDALGLDSSWYAVPSAQKNGRGIQTP